jgi:hypothetical protein
MRKGPARMAGGQSFPGARRRQASTTGEASGAEPAGGSPLRRSPLCHSVGKPRQPAAGWMLPAFGRRAFSAVCKARPGVYPRRREPSSSVHAGIIWRARFAPRPSHVGHVCLTFIPRMEGTLHGRWRRCLPRGGRRAGPESCPLQRCRDVEAGARLRAPSLPVCFPAKTDPPESARSCHRSSRASVRTDLRPRPWGCPAS